MSKIALTAEDVHSLSVLMSLPKEEFLKHFEGKDLGYVMSMKNFATVMFNDAQKTKDDLVKVLPLMKAEKKSRAKLVLDNLYDVLQNLENKFYLLKEMEDKRRSIPFSLTGKE